jgi:hypothetical protein
VKLNDIGLNGRDFNVCFWADLQSFYLLAIGMKADSNVRQNFNLIGLGNYYTDEFGFVNDSFGVLANMIGTHSIIENKEVRHALLGEFNRLKPISKQHERPIMLSTLEPRVCVCRQMLGTIKNSIKSLLITRLSVVNPAVLTLNTCSEFTI